MPRDEIGIHHVGENDVTDKEVELILTRSIRRKLVIVLAVVFAMVVMLSIAGLSALYAYWSVVDNLRFSRDKEPRRADLAAAMAGLAETLVQRPPEKEGHKGPNTPAVDSANPEIARPRQQSENNNPNAPLVDKLELIFDERLWEERLKKSFEEHSEFYRRWDLHSSKERNSVVSLTETKLNQIKFRLKLLEEKCKRVRIPEQRETVLKSMSLDVLQLQTLVHEIPNPESVVDSSLRSSNDAIGWRLWLIGCPTAIVLVLFFGMTYFGYRWILIPIRKLHDAASRVANGDYTYRLKLRGKDEMVELAELFNKMTARFQTDKTKLDQEVEERSRAILRNERLAGIGYFASGIAHEINNPLQAIGAAAESLTGRLSEGSLGQQLPKDDRELLATYLGMIERESTRCQQITSRVLDFARGTNGPKSREDLTKIVTEVLEMVTHMSKFDNRKIVFDRSRAHMVEISAAEMKQVVLNLVANGLEAMNGSGTMRIQIVELVDEIVLSIQDDGCGMTAKVIENLYEPFFTEKLNGKGTGLGLSITHRIVGDHGGRIEATSDGPGRGSTFRVHLPRCARKTTAA